MRQKTGSFAEFFAGVGLVRLALESEDWSCAFANDIESRKLKIYERNFAAEDYVLNDIWKLEPEQIPKQVDLYTASFPCVDLSVAGSRGGLEAARSGTFWALIDILRKKRDSGDAPKFVLLENVYGFLTTNGGRDLKDALRSLNELNYVVDVFIVNATHFTPQSRVRLFVLGVDRSIVEGVGVVRQRPDLMSKWQYTIENADPDLRTKRLKEFIINDHDCDWFTLDLPTFPKRNSDLIDIIEHYSSDSDLWWRGERYNRVLSQIPSKQLDILKANQDQNEYKYGTIFKRMRKGKTTAEVRFDGIAGCLRTPRGGSSKQILARSGKGAIDFRLLTPREYARLQGVNDEFILSENDNESFFAMGDAVCVPAISWIAQNYLQRLTIKALK